MDALAVSMGLQTSMVADRQFDGSCGRIERSNGIPAEQGTETGWRIR
jgi:hypothetical protein